MQQPNKKMYPKKSLTLVSFLIFIALHTLQKAFLKCEFSKMYILDPYSFLFTFFQRKKCAFMSIPFTVKQFTIKYYDCRNKSIIFTLLKTQVINSFIVGTRFLLYSNLFYVLIARSLFINGKCIHHLVICVY